jgi:signal transduction histidine kinase
VQIERVLGLSREAAAQLRSVIFELRPADLETDGLIPTLRKHVDVLGRAYNLPVEVSAADVAPLPPSVELALFRIAQEALHNAVKHAAPTKVSLTLEMLGEAVALTVTDDGHGFETQPAAGGVRRLGLTSMRERAESIGGTLTVSSSSGTGTQVRATVPRG